MAGDDEVVEVVHDFFDGGAEVPEVEVEDVDVCCAELFEGGGEAGFDGFGGVAAEVDAIDAVGDKIRGAERSKEDAYAPGKCMFAKGL